MAIHNTDNVIATKKHYTPAQCYQISLQQALCYKYNLYSSTVSRIISQLV